MLKQRQIQTFFKYWISGAPGTGTEYVEYGWVEKGMFSLNGIFQDISREHIK